MVNPDPRILSPLQPPPSFTAACYTSLSPHLASLSPSASVNVLWAAHPLGHSPSKAWASDFFRATGPRLAQFRWAGQHLLLQLVSARSTCGEHETHLELRVMMGRCRSTCGADAMFGFEVQLVFMCKTSCRGVVGRKMVLVVNCRRCLGCRQDIYLGSDSSVQWCSGRGVCGRVAHLCSRVSGSRLKLVETPGMSAGVARD